MSSNIVEVSSKNPDVSTMNIFTRKRMSTKHLKILAVIIVIIVISCMWLLKTGRHLLFIDTENIFIATQLNSKIRHTEKFSNDVSRYEDFRRLCYRNSEPESIEDLNRFVGKLRNRKFLLCEETYNLFHLVYQVRVKYTTIAISEPFMKKVRKWLHDDEILIKGAKNQSLIFVDNLYSQESVVFNPVRANRPGVGAGETLKYVQELVENTSHNCDFCLYGNSTAADSFGRMESDNAVIISNTFKIEKYHGMALLRTHNPLMFTQTQFIDCMYLVMQWFHRVHRIVPDHLYRIMYWDILPKASASQVHPHIHLTLGDYSYYAKWNKLYKSGLDFSQKNGGTTGKNYWKSLLQIHTALGLSLSFGKASVMAYLTPQKDFEVIVLSEKPSLDFFRLVFFTLRSFIDDLNQYALSMGFVFPKINSDDRYGDELPMLMRIVSRGPADSSRSDVSSFDLFGTANVNKDPFKVINKIKASVMKRKIEYFTFPEWKD